MQIILGFVMIVSLFYGFYQSAIYADSQNKIITIKILISLFILLISIVLFV